MIVSTSAPVRPMALQLLQHNLRCKALVISALHEAPSVCRNIFPAQTNLRLIHWSSASSFDQAVIYWNKTGQTGWCTARPSGAENIRTAATSNFAPGDLLAVCGCEWVMEITWPFRSWRLTSYSLTDLKSRSVFDWKGGWGGGGSGCSVVRKCPWRKDVWDKEKT